MNSSEIKQGVISQETLKPDPVLPRVLVNIQFLRFVAAMLVVFYHSSKHVSASGHEQGWFYSTNEAVGFAGVDIFFVISGFIMAYTTSKASGFAPGFDFARRRLARIFSGYWPFYLIALLMFAWIGGDYLANAAVWRSAILWPAPRPLIPVSWTLVYEMYFYLLFTLLILFTDSKRTLLIKLLMLAVVSWSIYSQFIRHAYDPDQIDLISYAEAYMFNPYLFEFLAGALLAGWLSSHQKGPSWSLLLAGIAMFLAGGWINNEWFSGQLEQGYHIFWRVLIFGPASLLMLAGLIRLEFSGKKAPVRFSLMAGGASYAIYLCHVLWLIATQHLGLDIFLGQFSAWVVQLVFICYAVFILYYSILHYRIIERPLHRLFKKYLRI